jgi:hypothetical protein
MGEKKFLTNRKREEKTKMSLEMISERFRRFAIRECRGSSELYEQLSLNVAEDEEILRLASAARSGQPIPNLLFGAVHYLLLKGYTHELREFYGSMVDRPRNPQHAFPYFRDFCIRYQEDITAMLASKLVQTNEVRRCAYLYPSFCFMIWSKSLYRSLKLVRAPVCSWRGTSTDTITVCTKHTETRIPMF